MTDVQETYGIPDELQEFLKSGFLEVLTEEKAEYTVEFNIPSMQFKDGDGRITDFSVVWIHPDHNAQFCHYYEKVPGDLPNFYIRKDTTDLGDEILDIDSLDDLMCWLEEKRSDQ